ncbi:MAG: helix-turn-helix domain-containing protein [Clostridia bacterium]|nr:helix-turn-helix domain-containing protein [Clostridia bacterium]
MSHRVYSKDPLVMREEGMQLLNLLPDGSYSFRISVVSLVLGGLSVREVARSTKYTEATIFGWVKTVNEKGFEALQAKPKSGRPQKLTDIQKHEIDDLLQQDPHDKGYKVWDGPSVSDYILKNMGIEVTTRYCQLLFSELGYSRIRSQTFPSKGAEDTPERAEFKKNPRIKATR